uniref:Uncharacterized protein n=1 Tax=Candidatus Kentrum sp. LFY TaxID=2126342 RepID=A0A450WNL8_9GAMM|nr:MAG: hypothetical protein BECKLFY1418C_GA0070996_10462 [Candidatus Kentron sp. LFY]
MSLNGRWKVIESDEIQAADFWDSLIKRNNRLQGLPKLSGSLDLCAIPAP